jgi:hypothetical protein
MHRRKANEPFLIRSRNDIYFFSVKTHTYSFTRRSPSPDIYFHIALEHHMIADQPRKTDTGVCGGSRKEQGQTNARKKKKKNAFIHNELFLSGTIFRSGFTGQNQFSFTGQDLHSSVRS